jgi:predicted enzyme related to lactoylglutathione lyase
MEEPRDIISNDIRHNKIDYIEFRASDIAATKQFYSSAFGWNFVDYGPDYTSFQDGRLAGGFSKGEVTTGSGPLVVIHVDDLAAAYQRVKEAGGRIVKETFSFPGGSRFHFADPGGNELAVWHED